VKLALSGVINALETQEKDTLSAQRVRAKSRSSSPDQPPSQDSSSPVEVASNDSSSPVEVASNGSSSLKSPSGFSAIRAKVSDSKSSSSIEISSAGSAPSSPVQEISPGSASPVAQRVSTSTSIISATIGIGSPAPNTQSAIGIVNNVLSIQDCEELQKILRGRVFDGFRDVRSYLLPEELIPDSPLKIFHVDYGDENPSGNAGITRGNKALKEKFHNNFDKLVEKIHRSNINFAEQRLKSYLYAILAISSGESDSIPSFFECYDNLINGNGMKKDGPGHGSWIEKAEDFVKLKMIVSAMDKIHEDSVARGNPAFTEKKLEQWMIAQVQDRRIEEFKFLSNKEFVDNLIGACDCSTLDAKTSELKIAEKHLKSFLSKNTSFVEKLANISTDVDDDNKGLANHLLDHLFKNMSSKNSRLSPIAKNTYDQQLEDLRENLTKKILAFKDKLSSGKLSALDSDDHLILDLILEIPTKFDDILKSKFTNHDDQFEVDDKIEDFVEKLGKRKSIFEFRKTCIDQAEIYANKAKEIQASPAKSSQGR
jgi:hypothetical protein